MPSIPSLAALASDPLRTHRTWIPKYGRVQKCDFCNGRAPGTLHFCSVCQLHICENCARDRRWHTERQHFIDADALDWTFRRGPNTASTRGGRRAQAPSSSDANARERGDNGGDDNGDDDVYMEKGLAGNNNNPPRRSDRLAGSARTHPPAGMGTTGGNTTSSSEVWASIDAPPATPEDHDHLVLHLYEAIYGSRPELNPARYPRDPSHTQGGAYAPTLRTTPAFHPLNERTSSELELMHQDRQLLREMQHAWNNQPVLLRLCRNGHRVYAIELLWDVCELRRSRVLIRDFSQVVHWFVTERDSQFRLQHTAAVAASSSSSAQPGYYQPPYPSYPPPGAPGNAR
ncbi:76466a98-7a84-4c6f-9c1e-fc97e1f01ba1 [Thermothielavioides terrestris]|uniref:76466a98-7a84-4c6f-9c1e-fc97e1f01ba1 n=1 Tax=Thermothielavioides terrestris TaxID=2587410 RepID=A0A446B8R1_9PEZI|nr:76466a98-7a84-4c6f-9c1e-fc97e1f01ba1 [Thermothielavioides terrestris]